MDIELTPMGARSPSAQPADEAKDLAYVTLSVSANGIETVISKSFEPARSAPSATLLWDGAKWRWIAAT